MSGYLKSEEEKKSGVSNFLQFSKQKPIVCPKCGKKVSPVGGVKIEKCPFCREVLSTET
jgi:uncharacterized CHY-type Zn-finger protein